MTFQQSSTSGSGPHPEESSRKSDLSVTKVSAAALAAITAAVLGSTLGVAGTVMGAAVASIVTTVSTTLYQRSLERSREKVRLLTTRTMPLPRQHAEPDVPQSPTTELEEVQPLPVPGRDTSRPRRTVRWTALAAGSVAAFALAMAVITGFERATGQALSGGDTPTLPKVFSDEQAPEPAPEAPAPETSPTPSQAPVPTSSPEATSTSTQERSDPSTDLPTTGTTPADTGSLTLPLPTR